jgi:hypothetical protein
LLHVSDGLKWQTICIVLSAEGTKNTTSHGVNLHMDTDKISHTAENMSNAAGRVADSAGKMMDQGREKLNDLAETGRDYMSSANSALASFVREEPMFAMVTIFAAGYIVARLLNAVSRR